MGTSTSIEEENTCFCCGCSLGETKPVRCARCHASVALRPRSSSKHHWLSRTSDPSHDALDHTKAPNLEHVWIGTFEDSLIGNEEKEITCDYLIDSYLKPYFAQYPNELIQSGMHWVINRVHFKIYSCYPPIGKISSQTRYHLDDESGTGQRLLKFYTCPIERIHILPTLASYKQYNTRQEGQHHNRTRRNSSSVRREQATLTNELFDTHIKPYLKGRDILRRGSNKQFEEILDNKQQQQRDNNKPLDSDNLQTDPNTTSTQDEQTDTHPIENNEEETDSYCKPLLGANAQTKLKKDGPNDDKDEKEKEREVHMVVGGLGNDMSSHRHFVVGETFMSKGIQFRVMACQPTNGLIGATSTVYLEGEPLEDISRLSLQAVYESLPNHRKNLTPTQFRQEYIDPYFKGRFRFVDRTRELNMHGTQVALMNSEPISGIVTEQTAIDDTKPPLKADDLRQQQEEEDLELARRLEQEEKERNELPPPRIIWTNFNDPEFQRMMQGHSGDEQLQTLLQIWQQLRQHATENRGLPTGVVDRLPSYEYKKANEKDDKNSATEDKTCRICLVEFEDGDKLRWMPCFHRYHQECIDRWLGMNRKCPICKTDVSQSLRQDRSF